MVWKTERKQAKQDMLKGTGVAQVKNNGSQDQGENLTNHEDGFVEVKKGSKRRRIIGC